MVPFWDFVVYPTDYAIEVSHPGGTFYYVTQKAERMTMDNTINLKFIRTTSLVLTSITVLSFIALTRITTTSAATTATANASINVSSACTMSSGGGTYSQTALNSSTTTITANPIVSTCNDYSGFKIYAIGDSNSTLGNTDMIASTSSTNNIKTDGTGTYNSYWKMKIDNTANAEINATIPSTYTSYTTIPNEYALIASYNASTGNLTGSITPSYEVYIANLQPAGTYTGKVRYTLVHPGTAPAPTKSQLYYLVANMSKGKQTAADLQATITTPTSSDPATDTSNSGVFEYNSEVFGISSDASNDYPIYYYRGILDSSYTTTVSGGVGTTGNGGYYPNYVVLSASGTKATTDTCWRIFRTTGSGGIKMIYNGKWTGSTCANYGYNATVGAGSFGKKGNSSASDWYNNANRVGYTFNNDPSAQEVTVSTPVGEVFGDNTNYSTINNTDSNVKDYLENTWFPTISSFESILETSAGYCNDRSLYRFVSNVYQPVSSIIPYGTNVNNSSLYYRQFAYFQRQSQPSLTCPRGTVDLYTVSGAVNGNGQLKEPVALMTIDEVRFVRNYFLRNGQIAILLMTPAEISPNAAANVSYLDNPTNSQGTWNRVTMAYNTRPVISLKAGTTVASGSGTATDPWVVTAPQN